MKRIIKTLHRSIFLALCMLMPTLSEAKTAYEALELISVGTPIEYKNLKIYPLYHLILKNSDKVLLPHEQYKNYVTLDQASKKGWIAIKEKGSGIVNTVTVKNNGPREVLVLSGEIISGAKQDRTVAKDILLPAHSEWTDIPVFCVEHGRWHHVSPGFKSANMFAPNSVRKKVLETKSQSEVWSEISSLQSKSGIQSETQTVLDNYKHSDTKNIIKEYEKHLSFYRFHSNTIGVVVTTGDRIISVEMFSTNKMLGKYWSKLIKSWTIDALYSKRSKIERHHICDLLDAIKNADQINVATPGLGKLFEIECPEGTGSALFVEELLASSRHHLSSCVFPVRRLVHLNFFPSYALAKPKLTRTILYPPPPSIR